MCRVCIAYVSGMYRNFWQSYDIFFVCKYQTRNRTKKSPLMQNINGDAAEPLVLEFSEFQRCALVSNKKTRRINAEHLTANRKEKTSS